MSILVTLLDHVSWADTRAREAIAAIDPSRPEREQAVLTYAHLAAAEHVWLARIQGSDPVVAIWPSITLDDATALAAESQAGLRAIAAGSPDALAREVEYRNSAGQPFRNSVADILAHVALHGSYHRGQLALITRQSGGIPAVTDYIVFLRGVATPNR